MFVLSANSYLRGGNGPSSFALVGISALMALGASLSCERDDQVSPRAVARASEPAISPSPLPTPPRDYVAEPMIDASEASSGPDRIISLAPSITELCGALGLADRLVGRTQFCTYPPSVSSVPIVGAYTDTNLEAILAAKPDLVLVTASSPKLEGKLRALDLPVEVLSDSSYEDVFEAIRKLGSVTQRPLTARRLIDNLKTDIARLEQPPAPNKRVLLVTGPMPIPATGLHVAGPGSVLDRFLRLAGCENAMAGRLERPWARISVEQVLAANPDIIIETRDPADEAHHDALYRAWSPIAAVNALRNRRIRTLPRWIELPGPRINVILYRIVVAVRD